MPRQSGTRASVDPFDAAPADPEDDGTQRFQSRLERVLQLLHAGIDVDRRRPQASSRNRYPTPGSVNNSRGRAGSRSNL